MSRWWRDRLAIGLGPRGVKLARFPVWSRSAAKARAEYVVEAPAGQSNEEPFATLAAALTERRWRDTEACVTLHGHFVRWLLLPFSEAIATDAEREAYARVEFESVHGERARGWMVRVADTAVGESAPACALDTGFLAELRSVCEAAHVHVRSAVPAFAQVLDGRGPLLKSPVSALAHAESGRLNLAVFERGRFAMLESARHEGPLSAALDGWLSRVDGSGVGAGLPRRVWVVGEYATDGLPGRIRDWDVVMPGEGAPTLDARPLRRLRTARN